MSYILNALRKSERDRQASQPGTITERINPAGEPRQKRLSALLIALVICNAVSVAGVAWFFSRDTATPASPPAQPAAKAELPAPPPPEPASKVNPAQPSISELMAAHKPAASLKSASEKPVQNIAQALPEAPIKPAPEPQAAMAASETFRPDDQPADQTVSPAIAQAPSPAPAKAVQAEIPFLAELPANIRQNIPRININVFVYTQDPAERFVMINMAKYVKGQQTPENLEIRDIRPDSLVLGYQGRVFQVEAP